MKRIKRKKRNYRNAKSQEKAKPTGRKEGANRKQSALWAKFVNWKFQTF